MMTSQSHLRHRLILDPRHAAVGPGPPRSGARPLGPLFRVNLTKSFHISSDATRQNRVRDVQQPSFCG